MTKISVLSTIIAIALTTTLASAKKPVQAHRDDTDVTFEAPDDDQDQGGTKDRNPPPTSAKRNSPTHSGSNCTTAKCKYGSIDDAPVSINDDATIGTEPPQAIALK